MGTVNRTVETDYDKTQALKLIESRATPFTLSVTDGKHRSTAQNKLQMLWMNEISQQLGDQTPEEVRGYCKLTIGVPILKAENAAFAEQYDKVVKPLPYPQKLKLMMAPFDFGVTRLMTTKQKSDYLDGIIRHFGEQGIVLTMPEEMRHPNTESSDPSPAGASDEDDAPRPEQSSSEPEGSPVPPPSGSQSSTVGKFDFGPGELQHLIDFAAKGMKEARTGTSAASKLQFLGSMHLQYRDAMKSSDALTALDKMNEAMEGVMKGERDADRIEAWMTSKYLTEANHG